jgi:hypothetical protein
MLISPKCARDLFTEQTQSAAVPIAPEELLHLSGQYVHGHVVVGDIALRCYKHKARWKYDDRDVRRAGAAFAALRLDLEDRVKVRLPAYRDAEEHGPEDWQQPNWRRQLVSWMFGAAHRKAFEERPDEEGDAWKEIGGNGLPGGLTWAEFVAADGRSRDYRTIAGTRPLQLLSLSGESWLFPRAYSALLDRWERVEEDLTARARLCTGCGDQGAYWEWRTATRTGYVTLCPPCSREAFLPYAGHLRGVLYASPRRSSTRADDYLCGLCQHSRAAGWDHCHVHGFVRGPLCGSCNTAEGMGISSGFLQRDGAVLHLLECRGCHEQRTLPPRFHAEVVRAHLKQGERHGRCRRQPHIGALESEDGVHRFQLSCDQHPTGVWTRDVTAAEATVVVRAFVDAVLAAPPALPLIGDHDAAHAVPGQERSKRA